MVKLKFPVRFGRDILEMVMVMIAVSREDYLDKDTAFVAAVGSERAEGL